MFLSNNSSIVYKRFRAELINCYSEEVAERLLLGTSAHNINLTRSHRSQLIRPSRAPDQIEVVRLSCFIDFNQLLILDRMFQNKKIHSNETRRSFVKLLLNKCVSSHVFKNLFSMIVIAALLDDCFESLNRRICFRSNRDKRFNEAVAKSRLSGKFNASFEDLVTM